jgi:hypothetical protein
LLQDRPPSAQEVLGSAVMTANAEQKGVLLHFGASWCLWCLRLDAMLESDEVGDLFHDNYVITHLTIQESDDKTALENPGAQEMLEAAGGASVGVPVTSSSTVAGSNLRLPSRCRMAAISGIRCSRRR